MKRRQFLRNTLALGTAGLLPNTGHASGVLDDLVQDVTPPQNENREGDALLMKQGVSEEYRKALSAFAERVFRETGPVRFPD